MKFKKKYGDIELDEVFLDSQNLSEMNLQQFEGVIEKPLKSRIFLIAGSFFLLVVLLFTVRVGFLQIENGESYFTKSENNRLSQVSILSERGVILDRNNKELVVNIKSESEDYPYVRKYDEEIGLSNLLGYVSYPKKDEKGFYWRDVILGKSGLEEIYNDSLQGENGVRLIEVDAQLNMLSENIIQNPKNGENLVLTIDKKVQKAMFDGIKEVVEDWNFEGGAGAIMNVQNGELISFVNHPEFDSNILSDGRSVEKIEGYFNDERKPFLNRVISGLYTPGSIIKLFLAMGALEEGIITENTTINSAGRIEIENKYNAGQKSIFKDWRPEGHGLTDVKWAIADSVNTFFYAIGGGYKNQEGLGIERIEKYISLFEIGKKTGINLNNEISGIIPNPEWKEKIFDERWYLGDTYNTSIGQFGLQVTPIQMLKSISVIANDGILIKPNIILNEDLNNIFKTLNLNRNNLRIVREAMRDVVLKGTAQNLNIEEYSIAAKTGTAQVGVNNEFFNSWAVGFYPYEEPEFAFVLVLERAKRGSSGSASMAIRKMFDNLIDIKE